MFVECTEWFEKSSSAAPVATSSPFAATLSNALKMHIKLAIRTIKPTVKTFVENNKKKRNYFRSRRTQCTSIFYFIEKFCAPTNFKLMVMRTFTEAGTEVTFFYYI